MSAISHNIPPAATDVNANKEGVNANQERATLETISPQLAREILSRSDPQSICRLSLVSRHFRDMATDNFLWKDLLERDFGKNIAEATPLQNCARVYRNRYRIHTLLKSLPITVERFSRDCHTSYGLSPLLSNDPSPADHGLLLFPTNFEAYLSSLSSDSLEQAFIFSVENRIRPLLRAIILSPKWNYHINHLTIGRVYETAAREGLVEEMAIIEHSPNFPTDSLTLGSFYGEAAAGGQILAMEKIEQLPGFDNIGLDEGHHGLGWAYAMAAAHNQINAMQRIEQLPRFAQISNNNGILCEPWGLVEAYREAATYGRIQAMDRIEQLPRFVALAKAKDRGFLKGIANAYRMAARNNQVEAMEKIEHLPGFDLIQVEKGLGLGDAYLGAAERGQVAAMERIEHLPGFELILVDEEAGLGDAYAKAAKNNKFAAMERMEKLPRFAEIPLYGEFGLKNAYLAAQSEGQFEAMERIKKLPRFAQALVFYEKLDRELVSAYIEAAREDRIDVVKRIEKLPRFKALISIRERWFIEQLGKAYQCAAQSNAFRIMEGLETIDRKEQLGFTSINRLVDAYVNIAANGDVQALEGIERIVKIPLDGLRRAYSAAKYHPWARSHIREIPGFTIY